VLKERQQRYGVNKETQRTGIEIHQQVEIENPKTVVTPEAEDGNKSRTSATV
jgi:hypothetical protein